MGIDHCFQQAKKSGSYDVFVRTRPDVAVFNPMPWMNFSLSELNYMPTKWRRGRWKDDSFFALPVNLLDSIWGPVMQDYVNGEESAPEKAMGDVIDGGHNVTFPVVIVRSASGGRCYFVRLDLQVQCKLLGQNNYFMTEHRT